MKVNSTVQEHDGPWSVTIRSGCTSIASWAFGRWTSLIEVAIPQGCTSIGEYAFDSCRSLISATIPQHCAVDDSAFCYSPNVKVTRHRCLLTGMSARPGR